MALPLKSAARLSVSNTNASGLLTNEENIVSSSSSSSSIGMGLNQTERFRRLIPYMTFYVPGSASGAQSAASGADYLPVNQAYSYAPAVCSIVFCSLCSLQFQFRICLRMRFGFKR